jgi:hypothetical protein
MDISAHDKELEQLVAKPCKLVNACWKLDASIDGGGSLHLPPREQRQSLAEFREALWEVSPHFGINACRLKVA